jgi:DNA polymerase-4
MASLSILHIDMDAFFASVEQLDDPRLRDRPLVVGGDSPRGVVAAASYAARRFGIHSAMPIFQAKQRCPYLVIVPPRRKRYSELSARIMAILASYTPLVEPLSIDEAYLDVTGCLRLWGNPRQIALNIKQRIHTEIGLTCSVGVAPNKFLAKIASDLNKPDGLTIIDSGQVMEFIAQLAIEKVPGVGQRAAATLAALGIHRLGQVRQFPLGLLEAKLGKFGLRLMALAQGEDDTPVVPCRDAKSVSSETTLAKDTTDREVLAAHLLAQSQSVARQLRRIEVAARTITLKIKTADFQRHTRSRTLTRPVCDSGTIYRTALELLSVFGLKKAVRLIGVGAGGFQGDDVPIQADLFAEPAAGQQRQKWEKVDRALDAIGCRYGGGAVQRGTLASGDESEK